MCVPVMNRLQAIHVLMAWDRQGKYVFTKHELHKLFPKNKPKTLSEGINRLVKDKLLIRAFVVSTLTPTRPPLMAILLNISPRLYAQGNIITLV